MARLPCVVFSFPGFGKGPLRSKASKQAKQSESWVTEGLQKEAPHLVALTLICQELSHLTSLKFLPRLLLVQKHTLRILTGPPSPATARDSVAPGSVGLCLGLGTFQDRVSPDITSYMFTVGWASYHPKPARRNVKIAESRVNATEFALTCEHKLAIRRL